MPPKKVTPKKVLMITRVNVDWDKLEEFNEWWGRVKLHEWTENGARHLGSYENFLGAPKSQIIRLWEFDDFSKWEKFMEWRLRTMYAFEPTSTKRGERLKEITSRVDNLDETVWFSIY